MNDIIRTRYQYSADDSNILIRETHLVNELIHKDNAPAITTYFLNGNIDSVHYYQLNELHNDNAPASVFYHHVNNNHQLIPANIIFYHKGKKHNTKGPAKLSYDTNGHITDKQYYFMGKHINVNELARAGYFNTNDIETKSFIMSML